MIIQKCDICGRIEGLKMLADDGETKYALTFTQSPIKVQLQNYKGESYDVYVEIVAQKTVDTNNIKMMYDKVSKNNTSLEDIFKCLQNTGNKPEVMQPLKLDNPYPSICDECKMKLLKRIVNTKEFSFESF